MPHASRLKEISRILRARKLDAFIATDMKDIRYLTGFTGSTATLIALQGRAVFVTDFRYEAQSSEEVRGAEVVISTGAAPKTIKQILSRHRVRRLGFDPRMRFAEYEALQSKGRALVPVPLAVLRLRAQKDAGELALIARAVERAEAAFLKIKPFIRIGARERAIALRLEEAMKRLGVRRLPFDIIAASGPNSAKPHAGASERKLGPGDLFILDWGGECEGYFSDMTRTFLMRGGSDLGRKKEIYDIVLRANRAGLAAVRAGARGMDIDKSARDVINKAGYGEYFGHGTGHGVGLDVHEEPRASAKYAGKIKPGMVLTVEPGVYLKGSGGVRIEDMAVAGPGGGKVLTSLPVDLEII